MVNGVECLLGDFQAFTFVEPANVIHVVYVLLWGPEKNDSMNDIQTASPLLPNII